MKILKIFTVALLLMVSFKSYSTVHVIKQLGTSFSPNNLTVNVGDVVRWEWSGGSHTTTSKTIPEGAFEWDSPLTASNTSFEYTVTVVGVYNYVCTPHESMGMIGSFTVQPATGVNENSSSASFELYPNPASSFINVTSGTTGELILCNVLGEKIKNFNLAEIPKNSDPYRIDLTDLESGIYFITIIPSDAKDRISAKFIKN